VPKLDNDTAKAVNKAEGSSFTLLDEDEYVLQLDKVVVSTKADVNGNYPWIWTFSVISGQITGDKFKGKTSRTNTGWAENQHWFAKMVFDAFGVKPNVDTDTLLGKQVKAVIVQREIQVGRNKGKMSNDIQTLLPFTTDEGGDDGWADEGDDTSEPDF